MPAPSTGRDLHVDKPLSNVLINRRPDGFIADDLLPITPVDKQSDIFYKFDHLEWFRHEDDLTNRAPGTEANKVHFTVTSDGYFAPNFALSTDWPVEDAVNADEVLQWAESSALFLADRLLMDYEKRVADLVVVTGNVGTVTTISSAWSDRTNSEPFTDMVVKLDQFRVRTGKEPNVMIMPQQVWARMKDNNQIRDLLFGDRGGVPTAQQLANLWDIPKVLIPKTLVNTDAEASPQTGTKVDIWGPHIWIAHVNLLQGRFTDTWLNAFRWTNPLLGVPFAIIRHPFDTKKRVFSIEASYYQAEKIVSSDLAERITNVVTT
jgi:hypothetical protein